MVELSCPNQGTGLQMIKQTCPNKAEGCKRNTNNQATLTHWNKAQGYK